MQEIMPIEQHLELIEQTAHRKSSMLCMYFEAPPALLNVSRPIFETNDFCSAWPGWVGPPTTKRSAVSPLVYQIYMLHQ